MFINPLVLCGAPQPSDPKLGSNLKSPLFKGFLHGFIGKAEQCSPVTISRPGGWLVYKWTMKTNRNPSGLFLKTGRILALVATGRLPVFGIWLGHGCVMLRRRVVEIHSHGWRRHQHVHRDAARRRPGNPVAAITVGILKPADAGMTLIAGIIKVVILHDEHGRLRVNCGARAVIIANTTGQRAQQPNATAGGGLISLLRIIAVQLITSNPCLSSRTGFGRTALSIQGIVRPAAIFGGVIPHTIGHVFGAS